MISKVNIDYEKEYVYTYTPFCNIKELHLLKYTMNFYYLHPVISYYFFIIISKKQHPYITSVDNFS